MSVKYRYACDVFTLLVPVNVKVPVLLCELALDVVVDVELLLPVDNPVVLPMKPFNGAVVDVEEVVD